MPSRLDGRAAARRNLLERAHSAQGQALAYIPTEFGLDLILDGLERLRDTADPVAAAD